MGPTGQRGRRVSGRRAGAGGWRLTRGPELSAGLRASVRCGRGANGLAGPIAEPRGGRKKVGPSAGLLGHGRERRRRWRAGWAWAERVAGPDRVERGFWAEWGRMGWVVLGLGSFSNPFPFYFFSFLNLNQTKFEFKYKFEFKPHSNN